MSRSFRPPVAAFAYTEDNYVATATFASTLAACSNPRILKSIGRFVRREYSNRFDQRQLHVLQVRGAIVMTKADRWGMRILADVEYGRQGACTLIAGRWEDGALVWQVYAD